MKEPPNKDRRRYPRYQCEGDARLRTDGLSLALDGGLSQISQGGCFIQTPDPLPPGTELDLELEVGDYLVHTRAVVLYSQASQGMGVGFLQTDEEQQMFLEALLTALAKSLPEV